MSIVEKFMTMEYGPAPEDTREALAWLDRHQRRFGHFINGTWQAPVAGVYFETADPSTGEKLATVAQGSAADIDNAVKAARAALPSWQALTPHARARYLYALARQVQKHSRWLAVLETLDNGKPIREYAQETGMAVGFKPAGGIRTAKQSLEWLALMKEELGTSWMKAELFRFGASGMLADIERQLEHHATGRYSADYRHPIA